MSKFEFWLDEVNSKKEKNIGIKPILIKNILPLLLRKDRSI